VQAAILSRKKTKPLATTGMAKKMEFISFCRGQPELSRYANLLNSEHLHTWKTAICISAIAVDAPRFFHLHNRILYS